LIKIIDKLLEKDPIRRFQTSADLKRSLINVLRQMDLVEEVERNKGFPMGIQWGAIMVLIVSLTMTAGIIVIDNRQFAAMSELAMDYGASMAQFIARQNIEPVALEDWPSVQVFAEYTARHPSFSYLYIVDSRGLTRGSMKPDESGGEHIADSSRVALADLAGTQVFQRETAEGELIYEFETPISVQGINIGKVIIGISQSPLHAVTLVTTWMLAALMLLTVAAVVVVVYLLARHLARPIKTLEQAFQNLAGGDLGFRISESRRDEFGRLFASFNHMAESLEENSSEPPDRSSDVVAVGETRVVVPPTP
jgi:serine/threonine-protein kinase